VEKVRVGVVGVGYFGQFHAEKYAKVEGVELVGVVDIDPSRSKEIAKRCQTQSFSHHSQLFDKVQAVSIAVPTPFHYSITKDFFLQGIDVLLEKPIAKTLNEADEMIRLAESKGLVFQVGHLERFNGAFFASKGMIHNPLFIECHRLGPFPGRGTEVNVVLDLMIHDIDIVLNLTHSKVKQLQAVGLPVLTRHLDVANARIEFENGCTVNLTSSRVSKEKIRKTRIFQPSGTISIDYLSQKAYFSQKADHPGKGEGLEMTTKEIPVEKADLLEAEICSFLQEVRSRGRVQVSGWDGKRALEVALQIIEEINRMNKK
jgi:predicted dehydrogenase